MIQGIHALLYAKNARKARAFFRDVLKLRTLDAGQGWLLFKLPPAEMGIHPCYGKPQHHELHLMCADIEKTIAALARKKVKCAPIYDAGWGLVTSFVVPGGGTLGLYEPKHPMTFKMAGKRARKPARR
jgi:catechol 2,3-dioxygenase-like lactoylglutathione lyase family enzyme